VSTAPDAPARPDTIVLVHGLWMTAGSWAGWVARYEAAGYAVLTPTYPGMDRPIAELRADPSPIAALSIPRILTHLAAVIRGLDRPPIIMGHSFGGAFTQVLLDRGLGAAGVAINSAPVAGFDLLPPSTLRGSWPVLRNPANVRRAVPMSPAEFHYAFATTMTREASDAVHAEHHVPASGRVFLQGALGGFRPRAPTRIDHRNPDRAPLLLIAGGADTIVPASLNRANLKRHQRSAAITGYREFPGRDHYTVGAPGWEDVADHALAWVRDPVPAGH
jgi:pimeloyl-ACP methyl ester carboxylesterase